jgi:hypothetical protein
VERVCNTQGLQDGVYRGTGSSPRELATDYGLRALWEQPLVSMRTFYRNSSGVQASMVDQSLYDASSNYVLAARSLLQNLISDYGGGDASRGAGLANDTSTLYILYNAPRAIMTAYQQTLDAQTRISADDSARLNSIQLIILAVEGLAIGLAAVAVIWHFARQVCAVLKSSYLFTAIQQFSVGHDSASMDTDRQQCLKTLAVSNVRVGLAGQFNNAALRHGFLLS